MEVDKQLSPDELDKECSILLELDENDPLFDKKKKLLQDNGFKTKEQVRIKRSSDPIWLSTSLKVMLQIARIIKLDEVELYFGGEEQLDSYSPRNELDALNSILQLVESSLSDACEITKNVLQDLRNLTIDKICEFAEENSLKTTIVEGQNSDKEKQLLQWGENNGVKTRLQIACVEGAGRGAIAREDLKVGDTALEIPTSLIISEELVQKTDMYHVLEKLEDTSSETMLLLWSMKERHNTDSQYKIYFDTLPEDFHTGLSFGISAVMSLYGTLLLDEIMQAKEHLRAQYDKLFPALCNEHPDIFPPELYTWEQFLWACELWYSNSMKIMFADGKLRTCLIPIAGFLNHSIYPHVVNYGRVDSATNTIKFRLSRPCSAGQECCLSYGNLSTSHLVTFYGFLPQGYNPYDVIPLDIGGADDDSTEGSSTSEWTTHMVRGTWFSENWNIFYYGLPSPFLDCLRRARNPMLLTKTLLPENLENEIEILEDLLAIFNDMMDSLGDADLDDRKNTSWDVKLAVDFKFLQRGIVSSILTSCHKGLDLVKHELSKMHG
ncbi:putative [Fructose-bisphosphate aldolase]-lysine N-methyltransferase [Rosa chinensis]|uniref:Putative [Fructose-bisphosphate aldolase]-lysine N-methyltransferase n=1 Tax=Rosa chinensis TaxID=74649 RepID=A0A2P6QTF0_ROSCH|nr:uncharacterized protein LOC112196087 [Rosa chinensis]PRQ37436.1 putative [Fructose-bisphosphate aldolase]-lysine N-methyltransferase [Rosa chinensis]